MNGKSIFASRGAEGQTEDEANSPSPRGSAGFHRQAAATPRQRSFAEKFRARLRWVQVPAADAAAKAPPAAPNPAIDEVHSKDEEEPLIYLADLDDLDEFECGGAAFGRKRGGAETAASDAAPDIAGDRPLSARDLPRHQQTELRFIEPRPLPLPLPPRPPAAVIEPSPPPEPAQTPAESGQPQATPAPSLRVSPRRGADSGTALRRSKGWASFLGRTSFVLGRRRAADVGTASREPGATVARAQSEHAGASTDNAHVERRRTAVTRP